MPAIDPLRTFHAVGPKSDAGRLRTGSFGVCNRGKQKFVVGTVDGKSRPIVSKQAHRGDKAGRLIRSPVLVVQRLFATGAVGGMDFGATKGHRLFFNTIDPVWILSSRSFDPRVAFYRHRQPISPQMNCRCDGRCGPPVSGGGLVHGGSRQIFDPRDHQSTVRVTPLTHEPQQPLQRPAQLGQRLLNFRRHLSIHLAMNQPVAFEFP